MARIDWQTISGTTNNNSAFFTGIRWRYRDDLFGTGDYPSDRVSSNTDIIEYQPYVGKKSSAYTSNYYSNWLSSNYKYSYNATSGEDPGTASNQLNVSTTFRFDKASVNSTYYLTQGSLSTGNVMNTSSSNTSRIIEVPHCNDGTSKLRLYFYFAGNSNTSFTYAETNGIITLETIPRASSITVNDANIGSSTNIVINKANSNFTTSIYYRPVGEQNWVNIVSKTPNQVYGWTVPTLLYPLFRYTKTKVFEFYGDTYNGDTLIGTSSTTTATFTATGNPTIDSSSAIDTNTTTVALTGDNTKMIKYASNVQISITASGINSAYMSSASVNNNAITLDGTATTTTRSGNITFNSSTTNTFIITATDSRGYQTSTTKTMTMIDYVPLSINATIKRNQPTDEKVNINFSGNYYNGSFGSQSNSLTVQYRYKESSSYNWGNWTNVAATTSGNTYTGSTQISNIDYTKQYDFEIQAIDKIQIKPIIGIRVSKGQPVYWWDDDQFNLNGKLYTSNAGREDYAAFGFTYDGAGNMKHKRNDSGDSFQIQAYNGTATVGINPENGNVNNNGKTISNNGFYSRETGEVGTPSGSGTLMIKRATNSEAPNNGVVLEYGNSTSWVGQLYIGDNADQGVYYNGWSNGTRGNWKKLMFITETGSNNNGNYMKFDDGTLICTKRITGTVNISSGWGNGQTSSGISLGNWAYEFLDEPVATVSCKRGQGGYNYWLGALQDTSKTFIGNITLLRFTSSNNVNYIIYATGIGRWK